MRLCLFLIAAIASAQSSTSTYATDINGRRDELTTSGTSKDGTKSEYLKSINGRQIPLEQVEEKILNESPSGKTIERTVRKYDQTGALNGTEKIRIEEENVPGGGTNVKETTWRTDVNGSLREAERRNIETRISGSSSTTNTVIATPDVNGAFAASEKRVEVKQGAPGREETNETVQRRDTNGQFYDAFKEVKVVTKSGNETTENKASYELGSSGKMELARQAVSTTAKRPDGSEIVQTNLYGRSADGQAQESGAGQKIKEQQIIERKKSADGSVVESFSVRSPTVSDPSRLGDVQKLSETVCRGKCQ